MEDTHLIILNAVIDEIRIAPKPEDTNAQFLDEWMPFRKRAKCGRSARR
jgi:hypothetical protein